MSEDPYLSDSLVRYRLLSMHAVAGAEALERAADKAEAQGNKNTAIRLRQVALQLRLVPADADVKRLFEVE